MSPMPEDLERDLRRVLADADAASAGLRAEIARQRLQQAQHAEIERLEEHLASAVVRWDEVRSFFDHVLHELRGDAPAWHDDAEAA